VLLNNPQDETTAFSTTTFPLAIFFAALCAPVENRYGKRVAIKAVRI